MSSTLKLIRRNNHNFTQYFTLDFFAAVFLRYYSKENNIIFIPRVISFWLFQKYVDSV